MNLVAIQWLGRWRADRNRSIQQIRGRLLAGVMGAIQMIESVKAAGSESDLLVRWSGDQARMINAEQELGFWDNLLLALPPALASLTAIAVLGLGGREVIEGGLSIGMLVAFQSLLAYFNQPFRDMKAFASAPTFQELRADLDRIDDVRHNRPVDTIFTSATSIGPSPSLDGQTNAVQSEPRRLSGHIEFRGVTFGYNRTVEEPVDQGFLIRRPARAADRTRRQLRKWKIDHRPAGCRVVPAVERRDSLRRQARRPSAAEVFINTVELVDSDICLFEGTVRENLTLWDEMVPSDRVIQAAVDAAIHGDLLQRRGLQCKRQRARAQSLRRPAAATADRQGPRA